MKYLSIIVLLIFCFTLKADPCSPNLDIQTDDQTVEEVEAITAELMNESFKKCIASASFDDTKLNFNEEFKKWSKYLSKKTNLSSAIKSKLKQKLIEDAQGFSVSHDNCAVKIDSYRETKIDVLRNYYDDNKKLISSDDRSKDLGKVIYSEKFLLEKGKICRDPKESDSAEWYGLKGYGDEDRNWEKQSELFSPCTVSFMVKYNNNDFANPVVPESSNRELQECIQTTTAQAKKEGRELEVTKVLVKGYASGLANTKPFHSYKDIQAVYSKKDLAQINKSQIPSYLELSKLRAKYFSDKVLKPQFSNEVEITSLGLGMLGPCPYDRSGNRLKEFLGNAGEAKLDQYKKVVVTAQLSVKGTEVKGLKHSRKVVRCLVPQFKCK